MGSEQCFCLIIIFLWRLCFSCYSEPSDLAGNSLLFSVDSHVHIGMHKPTNIYSVTSVCKALCCDTDVELIKKTVVALRELTIQEQIQYWCSLRHFSHMQRDCCSNQKEERHTVEQVKSKQALLLHNSFGFHISSGSLDHVSFSTISNLERRNWFLNSAQHRLGVSWYLVWFPLTSPSLSFHFRLACIVPSLFGILSWCILISGLPAPVFHMAPNQMKRNSSPYCEQIPHISNPILMLLVNIQWASTHCQALCQEMGVQR